MKAKILKQGSFKIVLASRLYYKSLTKRVNTGSVQFIVVVIVLNIELLLLFVAGSLILMLYLHKRLYNRDCKRTLEELNDYLLIIDDKHYMLSDAKLIYQSPSSFKDYTSIYKSEEGSYIYIEVFSDKIKEIEVVQPEFVKEYLSRIDINLYKKEFDIHTVGD
jgi:hypothetical protein